jgi:prophage regulatory protein
MLMTVGRYLMGAKEIEDRLGVSRQRVYQITSHRNFPDPYDTLAMGNVWRIDDVEAWIREYRKELVDSEPGVTDTPSLKGKPRVARAKPDSPQP